MGETVAELLRKSLGMTPEQLRTAQARAKEEQADVEKGKRKAVGVSADFERIRLLSERPWNYFQRDEFVDAATETLRTPEGTMRLRPVQAAALIEAQRVVEAGAKGTVNLMGVGSGKALVSMLLGTVLNSQKCVLLVPPSLVEQTTRVYNQMRKHWQVMPSHQFFIVSYSTLSSPKNGDILERIKPDLIVADEASALKNRSAARTKRVLRHLHLFKPKFCILSGTLTTRSLKDFQHLMEKVFGDLSPVPSHWPTLGEWCEALDSNVHESQRRPPGVILNFRNSESQVEEDRAMEQSDTGALSQHEIARIAFRTRLVSTLGVVATAAEQLGTSLVFSKRPLELSPKVKIEMDKLQETWERPDGEAFSDVFELAAVERELSCGFWYRWVWPQDKEGRDIVDNEWLDARKNWSKAVRTRLTHAGPGIDSPLLVFNAAMRSYNDRHGVGSRSRDGLPRFEHEAFEPWLQVKDRPVPPTVPVWVDEYFMVDDAVAWGREKQGIIWYVHSAVGEKIAERGGFPHYGPGKKASEQILDETGNRTIVVSMNAHSEGKNLQNAFSRNLFTTPFASGKLAEQVIGRTHRPGQPEDEVVVDIYLHTHSFQRSWASAMRDAHYMQTLLGPQKLVYGTKTFED